MWWALSCSQVDNITCHITWNYPVSSLIIFWTLIIWYDFRSHLSFETWDIPIFFRLLISVYWFCMCPSFLSSVSDFCSWNLTPRSTIDTLQHILHLHSCSHVLVQFVLSTVWVHYCFQNFQYYCNIIVILLLINITLKWI